MITLVDVPLGIWAAKKFTYVSIVYNTFRFESRMRRGGGDAALQSFELIQNKNIFFSWKKKRYVNIIFIFKTKFVSMCMPSINLYPLNF